MDDNRDAADALGALLERSGLSTEVVYDGEQALERVHAHTPDVVLLDIGMPRMDGYEFARRVRDDPAVASVKLIALSGWGTSADKKRAFDAGIDHHIVKPVEFESLKELIRGVDPR